MGKTIHAKENDIENGFSVIDQENKVEVLPVWRIIVTCNLRVI